MREHLLLDEPWSWLLGRSWLLPPGYDLDGSGSPRLLCTLESECPKVSLPTGQANLPAASFPFFMGRHWGQAFHLPTDPRQHREGNSFVVAMRQGDLTCELKQSQCITRPIAGQNREMPHDRFGNAVSAWIDWQIWAFQELGHIPADDEAYAAATREGCVRRSWDKAVEVWFRDGRDSARMALIVELSRHEALHSALDAISRSPRRILQRVREEIPLGRIQELDPVCIRDFARRPGVTAVQKAGPRQQLLGVRRREQLDTLENRVTCWVLETVGELSRDYCRTNASFANDSKVDEVSAFGRRAMVWRRSKLLNKVAKLQYYPNAPNYPLQFEPRYRQIWAAYLRIRREKTVLDDAWAWQRVLWGETGRQLLGCCLHWLFEETLKSTPFYRTESRKGHWTEPPVGPGPFRSPWGECLVFDSRDLDSAKIESRVRWLKQPPFPGAEHVGASGCDQILVWPQKQRALLVWHLYHLALTGSRDCLQKLLERSKKALEVLADDVHRFTQTRYCLSGLLLIPDFSGVITPQSGRTTSPVVRGPGPCSAPDITVNALCLPPDPDARETFVQDLVVGFKRVVEELHR